MNKYDITVEIWAHFRLDNVRHNKSVMWNIWIFFQIKNRETK
jgi:hypothetical protein